MQMTRGREKTSEKLKKTFSRIQDFDSKNSELAIRSRKRKSEKHFLIISLVPRREVNNFLQRLEQRPAHPPSWIYPYGSAWKWTEKGLLLDSSSNPKKPPNSRRIQNCTCPLEKMENDQNRNIFEIMNKEEQWRNQQDQER